MTYNDYKQAMLRRFIAYRRKHYPLENELFDPGRWHVFKIVRRLLTHGSYVPQSTQSRYQECR
jgi:hypothetical protein